MSLNPISQSSYVYGANAFENPFEGYDFELLKSISDVIITNPYYSNLVEKSVYKINFHYGENEITPILPESGRDFEIYKTKIPYIVLSVKNCIEKKLHKTVAVENLLEELSTNHNQLFDYVM